MLLCVIIIMASKRKCDTEANSSRPTSSSSASTSVSKVSKYDPETFINFTGLIKSTSTREDTVKFCQRFGILPKCVNCPSCGVILNALSLNNNCYNFRCSKRSCLKRVYLTQNTWFQGRKISLEKVLVLTYCFVTKTSYAQAIHETSGPNYDGVTTSSETVSDTFAYCREVCIEILCQQGDTIIGGPNCIVEIDEGKFGKRKYNRGRIVDGQWVLGGICRETKKCFLVPIENKKEETLLAIIEKHVRPGSIVNTDCFKSYDNLEEKLKLKHYTVNHSQNFVDPDTGCHTNTIESTWWAVKRSFRSSHTRHENFAEHLAEYLYLKSTAGPYQFTQFLYDIAKLYPGN